ncbi:efflux RND transporter periplasmic adaptor subunit [Spongiibacter taiwanensis]|uniref:efflux RND transporter periplasmic adaptor subunit n=1 Tax=Spongiibacter taiwanensis TaxID=1748242 RepID=UPI002035BD70|nr:efflux RND transporter periplasmic adaptor subunit [Spongiibacter taiwanensis]USA44119.1 efflux RND transporter periplasmic adaptor subunit [Spongiibacter taiwanensis]
MNASSKQVLAVAGILALACVIALVLYWLRPPPERVDVTRPPLLVEVVEVKKQSQRLWLHSQGTVSPRTQTKMMTEVAGKVVSVSSAFETGALVNEGEVLLRIDDRDYQARLKRAEATVAAARSHLSQEKGRAAVAKKDMEDYPRKHVSEEARQLALRLPQIQDAQAQLDAAVADMDKARLDLERCTIKAPYQGIIKSRDIDLGQYLAVAAPIGEMFAVDSAEVRLPMAADKLDYLPGENIGRAQPPRVLPVILEDEQGQTWQAEIVRSEQVLDERSRVLFLVARISNPYGLGQSAARPLRVGTFVSARIQGRTIDDVVVLPRKILRTGNTVWRLTEEDRLKEQPVTMISTQDDQLIVTDGLEEGQRVVLAALPNATAGTLVQTQTSHDSGAAAEVSSEAQQQP